MSLLIPTVSSEELFLLCVTLDSCSQFRGAVSVCVSLLIPTVSSEELFLLCVTFDSYSQFRGAVSVVCHF